jgi:hypothetical protein
MASITLTRTAECAALNHITIQVTGDATYTYRGAMDDITQPITDYDKEAFIRVLLRFARIGRTNAQVRTAIGNGYTVTI